jgi:hypothetical protein
MTRGSIQASRAAAGAICRSALSRLALVGALISAATTVGMDVSVAQLDPAFETPNPAMFVARDDDTKIYMLGTIHILPCAPEADPPVCASGITPLIREAIAASDEVWLELSDLLGAADALAGSTQYPDQVLFNDGSRLSDYIPWDDMEIIAKSLLWNSDLFGTVEDALATIDLMTPWAVNSLLPEFALPMANGEWGAGVDFEVEQIARDLGIPVRGFETIEEQLALSWTYPLEYQVVDLRSAVLWLRHDVDVSALTQWSLSKVWDLWSVGELSDFFLWVQGNLDRVEQSYQAEMTTLLGLTEAEMVMIQDEIETYYYETTQEDRWLDDVHRLFDQRNLNWMTDINGMLDRPGTFFIAVGAAHLVGEFGLPTLLEGAGATVTRVQ